MISVPVGPVALPLAPLLLALAIWASSRLASRLAGPDRAAAAGRAITRAALAGLLAARIGHLALNAGPYLATPLDAFDLRDGGWNAVAGLIAGGAWLLVLGVRTAPLRRPLAIAAFAGTASWLAVTAALVGPRSGPSLPAVALTDLESAEATDLATAARGHPVVVNLWATWCGPCRAEMPVLAAAQARERSVRFLFVDQGESAATVKTWLDGQRFAIRGVLLDPNSHLGRAVGSAGVPATLFYGSDGRLVDAHFGALNAASLAARIRTLR